MIKFEPDEKLVLEVRKHFFVFFMHTLVSVFFAVLPLLVIIVTSFVTDINLSLKMVWLMIFGYSLWLLVVWVLFFIQWTDYYLDVWYITNEKIYDVLQKGFFHRQVSILRFDNIQDVTVEIRGLIPTLLDFGKIHVQTAGETSADFTLRSAKRPNEVKNTISELLEAAEKR